MIKRKRNRLYTSQLRSVIYRQALRRGSGTHWWHKPVLCVLCGNRGHRERNRWIFSVRYISLIRYIPCICSHRLLLLRPRWHPVLQILLGHLVHVQAVCNLPSPRFIRQGCGLNLYLCSAAKIFPEPIFSPTILNSTINYSGFWPLSLSKFRYTKKTRHARFRM